MGHGMQAHGVRRACTTYRPQAAARRPASLPESEYPIMHSCSPLMCALYLPAQEAQSSITFHMHYYHR